ncbi:radical SAM/SPASM domain-containing protein [Paraclostridium sordellii]|uniref:radical SAM/SPASM domain-containing protein n=1 Tax=Paraclostridium sordellii TaxID=1505 RepID=UPI0005DF51FC|nr:radical SAM protein [Paeniclostridium sordellii]CEN23862.1 radical SAM domain-containing protein [[Clostridium] sordellii] [Paeniclostridium sordellii]
MLNTVINKIKINEGNIIRSKGNLCYVYNTNEKKHIFISKEVLGYIKEASSQNLDVSTFINIFENLEDRVYISEVLEKLIEVGYININNNKEINDKKSFDCIHFMLTKRCNLKCIHCSSSCSPSEEDSLSLEDIKLILKNISTLSPSNIVFTGGEPLLRNDLEQIVEATKKLMPDTNLILATNGTLISENNMHLLKLFNKIDISIDGVNEESCSKVRGIGVFDKVIKNIKFLQDNEFYNIYLSMVFGEKTSHLVEDFKNLNEKLNTNPVFRNFSPIGRGYDNYNYFNEEKHHLPISATQMYKIKSDSRHISSCSCNAFESNLYIDNKGDVYPCLALINKENKIINFCENEVNFEEFLELLNLKKNTFKKILEYRDTKCEHCDLNIFCWNCPAVFKDAKENKEIDIWCKEMKESLNEIIWRQI